LLECGSFRRIHSGNDIYVVGLATSLREGDNFMDPEKIIQFAYEHEFYGPLQVYLDEQARRKATIIKELAQKYNIPLICHSLLGTRKLTPEELRDEIDVAVHILEGQEEKMIVFHYDPTWSREEFEKYLYEFNSSGLVPCIENPVADNRVYSKYLSALQHAVNQQIKFYLVIDFGKIFTQERGEFAFSQEESMEVLNTLLEFAEKNSIPLILHMMDSKSINFKDRRYWCPLGEGLIPYRERILPLLRGHRDLIKANILEYEDSEQLISSFHNWRSLIFGLKPQ